MNFNAVRTVVTAQSVGLAGDGLREESSSDVAAQAGILRAIDFSHAADAESDGSTHPLSNVAAASHIRCDSDSQVRQGGETQIVFALGHSGDGNDSFHGVLG